MMTFHYLFYRNLLECVPDWACEAKKIEILDASYNLLTEVPVRCVLLSMLCMCVLIDVLVCMYLIIFLDQGCLSFASKY